MVIWKRVNKDKLFKRTGVNVLLADRTVHSPQLMDTDRKKTLRYLWPVGTHSDKSVLTINLQHVPVLSTPHTPSCFSICFHQGLPRLHMRIHRTEKKRFCCLIHHTFKLTPLR